MMPSRARVETTFRLDPDGKGASLFVVRNDAAGPVPDWIQVEFRHGRCSQCVRCCDVKVNGGARGCFDSAGKRLLR